jgi:hypothetical protein
MREGEGEISKKNDKTYLTTERHLRHREKQNLLSCGFLLKVLFF